MPQSLSNKVVLVVGASSGIGKETARQFALEGAHVMAAARRADRLADLALDLASAGCPIETMACDATSASDMQRLADETRARLGPIDFLIYVSGTNVKNRAMANLDVDTWNSMVAVNLNGAYYATRAVLPGMRETRRGCLIYVSSISAIAPDVSGAAYQAAKRGLIGLAHATRVEEKEHGIRTCVICPGMADTDIMDQRPVKPSPEMLARALQSEDIAEMIVAAAKLPERATVTELHIVPTTL